MSPVLAQVVAAAASSLVGWSILRTLGLARGLAGAGAWACGVAAASLAMAVLAALASGWAPGLLPTAAVLALLCAGARLHRGAREFAAGLGISMGWAVLAAVALAIDRSVMSYDSLQHASLGARLALHSRFDVVVSHELASWPVAAIAVQALRGSDPLLPATAAPLLGFASMAAVTVVLVRGVLDGAAAAARLAAWGAVAVAGSAYFVWYQAAYENNHAASAAIAALLVWASLPRSEPARPWVAVALGLLLLPMRHEGPLLAAAWLAGAVLSQGRSASWRAPAAAFSAGGIAWCAGLAFASASDRSVIGPLSFTAAGVACTAPLLASFIPQRLDSTLRLSSRWHLWALAIALLLWLASPGAALVSVSATIGNLLVTGSWGATWVGLAGLLVISGSTGRESARPWWQGFIAGVAVIVAVGALRAPYRLGFHDSANRMLIELLPLAVLCAAAALGSGALAPAPVPSLRHD